MFCFCSNRFTQDWLEPPICRKLNSFSKKNTKDIFQVNDCSKLTSDEQRWTHQTPLAKLCSNLFQDGGNEIKFSSKCVVPENIYPPMESHWKLRGRGGVRREIFFQGVQEQCPKETYRDRICNLVDQQIHELQYISVYSNAIRTFSGHL